MLHLRIYSWKVVDPLMFIPWLILHAFDLSICPCLASTQLHLVYISNNKFKKLTKLKVLRTFSLKFHICYLAKLSIIHMIKPLLQPCCSVVQSICRPSHTSHGNLFKITQPRKMSETRGARSTGSFLASSQSVQTS